MASLPAPGGTIAGDISYAKCMGYWIKEGGDPKVANIAAAIAEAESGLRPSVVQSGEPAEDTGYGLWQVTPTSGITQNGQFGNLLNPANNAKAAVYLYKNAGNSFSPWTTFNDGSYKAFVGNGAADESDLTPAAGEPGADTSADCIFGGQGIGLGLHFPCLLTNSNARALMGGLILLAGAGLCVFGLAGLAVASGAVGAAEKVGGGAAEAAGAVATLAGQPEVGAPLMAGGASVKQHGVAGSAKRRARRQVSDQAAQERHTASQYKRQPRARANAQRDSDQQPAPF